MVWTRDCTGAAFLLRSLGEGMTKGWVGVPTHPPIGRRGQGGPLTFQLPRLAQQPSGLEEQRGADRLLAQLARPVLAHPPRVGIGEAGACCATGPGGGGRGQLLPLYLQSHVSNHNGGVRESEHFSPMVHPGPQRPWLCP